MGTAEQILVERVAVKIGMIIRRATLVVAGTTMPRSATPWLPRALPEGSRGAGSSSGGDARPRQSAHGAPTARYRVASSFGRHCSALRGLPRFYATPLGQGFAGGLSCQAPSEGERPRALPEGPCEARDRAAAGMSRPRKEPIRAFASRYGVASSFGRHCSALRGCTIRVVAFRASHPAKAPSRQRRFVQRFP
jgi:hypothetical protein